MAHSGRNNGLMGEVLSMPGVRDEQGEADELEWSQAPREDRVEQRKLRHQGQPTVESQAEESLDPPTPLAQ